MKRTLLSFTRFSRTGCFYIGLSLFPFTAIAQEQPADTVQVNELSRGLGDQSQGIKHYQTEKLNKGLITSTEQLLAGQVAGLRIIPGNGQPGAPAMIRLQAMNTVFGRQEPLIVLDGMPVESMNASAYTAFLSSINPQDIASISFSKDGAGIAVYGGRAANGVLFITTKAPQKQEKLKLTYNATAALSELRKKADVLTADEFRSLVQEQLPDQAHLLGTENTDWQDAIYQKAFSHDQNLALSGSLFKVVPFRLAAGHLNQQGILKTSQSKRNTVALSLAPSLLQDHLKLKINLKGAQQKTLIADEGAVISSWAFDPTKPIYKENGDFYYNSTEEGVPHPLSFRNPLSLLEQQQQQDNTASLFGQAHLKYSLHGLPSLQLNLRYGLADIKNNFSNELDDKDNLPYYSYFISELEATRRLEQNEAYVSYDHPTLIYNSKISLLAGASFLHLKTRDEELRKTYEGEQYTSRWRRYETSSKTFFGKIALTHNDKYRLEAAFAHDSESYLASSNGGALSYSVGMNWDIMKESFIEPSSFLTALSLDASYLNFARTGFPNAVEGTIIDNKLVLENLQKFRLGTFFGLLENKLQGEIAFVRSSTKDMHMVLPISNRTGYNYFLTSSGEMVNSGVEAVLNYNVLENENINWSIGTNFTFNRNKIVDLPVGVTSVFYNVDNRPIHHFENPLTLQEGYPMHSFTFYEHIYHSNGKPINNTYKLDKNGQPIRSTKNSADPQVTFGLNSDLTYKNFDLGFLLRGNIGNYVYKNTEARLNSLAAINGGTYLNNVTRSYLSDGFVNYQLNSHHFLENASFVRMEYLQVGYNMPGLLNGRANLRLTATAQNAFVITKYSGQDPEIASGVDNGHYPMPRTYSLGVTLGI